MCIQILGISKAGDASDGHQTCNVDRKGGKVNPSGTCATRAVRSQSGYRGVKHRVILSLGGDTKDEFKTSASLSV